MDDLLAEFIAETREMLEATGGELVAWEADPADRARLDAVFRFVHTVKGNCGFFDFPRLAALSHAAEDALADLRAGRRDASAALVSAVLAIIDRIAEMVDTIEVGQELGEGDDAALIAALGVDADAHETAPAHDRAPLLPDHVFARRGDPAPYLTAPRTIRLPVELLDRVMSGVSDMVLARNDLAHRLRAAGTQPTIDGPFERLTAILSDVRDAITRMRMQRIETLFGALPRLVRDLSAELGKQVLIDLEGGNVELDREMIETIRDPVTHLIRNAIDHGIEAPAARLAAGKREMGLLTLSAHQSGNTIAIVVSDDGRGLDEERIAAKALATGLISPAERTAMSRDKVLQLIFEPGFSTAQQVSNVSGRGVGLDVVRQNLEKVGGSIAVSSQSGVGTLFTMQIPLTLSIIAGLTVEVAGQRLAMPQGYVEEIVEATAEALDYARMGETALITFRGERVPCLLLADVLGLPAPDMGQGTHTLALLRLASGDLFALAVERIHSHGDLVVKPLAPAVMKCGLYAGSALLDDGQPVLLLDVTRIAAEYNLLSDTRARAAGSLAAEAGAALRKASRAMLFTKLDGRRAAIRLELVQRIETIPASAVYISGKRARAVIDGVILPIAGVEGGVPGRPKLRLLRLSDGMVELLHAVSDVEDAIELPRSLTPVPDDPLVEGLVLFEGQPVTLLDGHELFARHGDAPQPANRPLCRIPDSEWARTILAPLVESAGYEVVTQEATAAGEVVTIINEDVYEAASCLGRLPEGRLIRLRDLADAPASAATIYRYDRDGLTRALQAARIESHVAATGDAR
jgi:two-component system, chemotaxis family, sensor kinase CheA